MALKNKERIKERFLHSKVNTIFGQSILKTLLNFVAYSKESSSTLIGTIDVTRVKR